MRRVLLIEDDDIIRNNTEEILRLAQYEVITANNGRKGTELAIKHIPDIIVCDILMPQLDGFGVLYILSKSKETASIPFIFLSAKALKSDIRRGMDLGADDYLCKPFDGNDLLSAIETRLKKYNRTKKESIKHFDCDVLSKDTDHSELQAFLGSIKNKHQTKYQKKEIIYHSDDIAQYLFILKSGRVKTYQTHEDGKEYITKIYKEGDIFGYTSILGNVNFSDSATALDECEVYKISKTEFLDLISSNSKFLTYFIKLLSGEIKLQKKQLLNLAYNSVRKRTADALLLLASSQNQNSRRSTISIGRDDLASLAGTAVETVIRCLGDMKEDGLISISNREITIEDAEALLSI
jgi:CRP-like cAMP-binding protein/ActR/RegA family two-component response regulator